MTYILTTASCDAVSQACCPEITNQNDFCFDSCWPPGDVGANCDRVWTVSVTDDCEISGWNISSSPATPQIVADNNSGTITLKCGFLEEGNYTVTYRAVAIDGSLCPAESFTIRSICPSCVGINSGFYNYWSAERKYVDQMKFAGFTRNSVPAANSSGWPVDANGWGTEVGPTFDAYFYTNEQANTQAGDTENLLQDTCWRVIWEGTGNVQVTGFNLVSNVTTISSNEIEFTLNQDVIGNAHVRWVNTVAGDHVRNVRIIPCRFADEYRNWSWEDFDCANKDNNPTIFFPEWEAKVEYGCVYRYLAGWGVSEYHSLQTSPVQDHSQWLLDPAQANFYDNWFSGFNQVQGQFGTRSFSEPPEMVAYQAICTGVVPHILFEPGTWQALQDGDDFIAQFAQRMCACGYDGPVYVEFGNEPWNFGGPFGTFRNYLATSPHPGYNGPNEQRTVSRSYALMSSDIVREFKDNYCSCNVRGIFNSQHYNIGFFRDAIDYIDKKCFQVQTGPYISNDLGLRPTGTAEQTAIYNAILSHFNSGGTQAQLNQLLYNEALNSSWLGLGSNPPHNVITACNLIAQYASEVQAEGMCYGFYEMGYHLNILGFSGPQHQLTGDQAIVRDAMIAYMLSPQRALIDKEIFDCGKENCVGPMNVYSMMAMNQFGVWSYWDNNFDDDSPAALQIKTWNDQNNIICTGDTNQ